MNDVGKLSPLQSSLLEALKWFDAFCESNHLTYYAIGGTLLGALRHNGFIPWDDDVDLGMPRKDFDALGRFSELGGRYVIETYTSAARDYCYPYAKVYDTTTTLVEHKRINISRGLFLDIFPIDSVGNTLEECYRNYREVEKQYRFYLTLVAGLRKGRSVAKNAAVLAARLIPFGFRNQQKVREKLNMLCASIGPENGKYCGNLLGAYGRKEIVEAELFGIPSRHTFEDMMLSCPARSEEYLEHIYGNWKALPPVEKRVSHHDFVSIDLTKPYR